MTACASGSEPSAKPSAIDAWPALAAAAESGARERVLLLRDGRVFTGTVTPGKDFYRVQVAGGHLQVPTTDVDALCVDLNEAWVVRRKRLPANQGTAHLDLAKWCLRHGLYLQAEQELNEAARLEPQLAELPVVRRRLAWATQRTALASLNQRPTAVASSTTTDTNASSVPGSNRDGPIPRDAELERLVRGLSAGVTLDFKTYIQPMLVNHCATAACHGATAGNGPRLVRLSRHGQVPRRITLRNLEETLAYVDRFKPSESLLLKKATEPHGGLKAGTLDRSQTAFRQLSHWVRRASGATEHRPSTVLARSATAANVAPASANLPFKPDDTQSPKAISQRATHKARPPNPRQAPSLPWVRELIDEESADGTPERVGLSVEDDLEAEILADIENDPFLFDPPADADELLGPVENLGDFTPVDMFDPEIFNRQFSPENRAADEASGSHQAGPPTEPVPDAAEDGDSPR